MRRRLALPALAGSVAVALALAAVPPALAVPLLVVFAIALVWAINDEGGPRGG